MALGDAGEYEKTLWSLLGFLARYAHQPVGQLLAFTVRDLTQLARQVGEYMEEENAQLESSGE